LVDRLVGFEQRFDLAARRGGVEFGKVDDARVLAPAVLRDLLVAYVAVIVSVT
jgi:hypothetical protein